MQLTEYELVERYFLQEARVFLKKTRLKDDRLDIALKNAGQTIFWFCSMLDLQRRREVEFKKFLSEDSACDYVRGIRFARNRVSHQFFQLLTVTDGMCFPIQLPAKFKEISWRNIHELPTPSKRFIKQEKVGAECYLKVMERKPVRHSIKELVDYAGRSRVIVGLPSIHQ